MKVTKARNEEENRITCLEKLRIIIHIVSLWDPDPFAHFLKFHRKQHRLRKMARRMMYNRNQAMLVVTELTRYYILENSRQMDNGTIFMRLNGRRRTHVAHTHTHTHAAYSVWRENRTPSPRGSVPRSKQYKCCPCTKIKVIWKLPHVWPSTIRQYFIIFIYC